MDVLILGGTVFVGRHLAAAARARGHRVTLFHRGRTMPEGLPGTESIHGDREGDLSELGDHRFDCVFDTSGYLPRLVRRSAEHLVDRTELYVFVSSLSVYADLGEDGLDENSELAALEDPTVERIDGSTYGGLKVLCEQAVTELHPEWHLHVRPGVLVGPHDPTDRFTYWVNRATNPEPLLAPPRETRFECTDARDLGEWMVEAAERRLTGTFNVSGPTPEKSTFGRLFDACASALGRDIPVVQPDESDLLAAGVQPWKDLPLWVGPSAPGLPGASSARSLAEGLRFRSLETTVRDTLDWFGELERDPKAGLSAAREQELIAGLEKKP